MRAGPWGGAGGADLAGTCWRLPSVEEGLTIVAAPSPLLLSVRVYDPWNEPNWFARPTINHAPHREEDEGGSGQRAAQLRAMLLEALTSIGGLVEDEDTDDEDDDDDDDDEEEEEEEEEEGYSANDEDDAEEEEEEDGEEGEEGEEGAGDDGGGGEEEEEEGEEAAQQLRRRG